MTTLMKSRYSRDELVFFIAGQLPHGKKERRAVLAKLTKVVEAADDNGRNGKRRGKKRR